MQAITRLFTGVVVLGVTACGGGSGDLDSDVDIGYVALGASDATGVGASPLSEGYVFEIEEGIQQRGFSTDLVNLGIPGAESDEIENIELKALLEVEDPDDIDLVTLWTGSNDIISGRDVENFEGDLASIFGELREKTSAFIVVANVPNLTQLPEFVSEPDADVTLERIQQFNAAIERQAAAFGVPVVDAFSQPLESYLVSDDGFHPSDAGHELIAQRFLEVIEPQLSTLANR